MYQNHSYFPNSSLFLIFSLGNDVNLARQTILDGKEVDENLLSRFLEYLKLMEYNVQHPCAEFIQVQHIVTQFYGLKANFSVVK